MTAPAVKDVASLLEVDRSTASRLVEQVVLAGYVKRLPSSEDRRRSELQLTTEGKAALDHLRAVRVRLLQALTDGWPTARVEAFVRAADDLVVAAGEVLTDDGEPRLAAGTTSQ